MDRVIKLRRTGVTISESGTTITFSLSAADAEAIVGLTFFGKEAVATFAGADLEAQDPKPAVPEGAPRPQVVRIVPPTQEQLTSDAPAPPAEEKAKPPTQRIVVKGMELFKTGQEENMARIGALVHDPLFQRFAMQQLGVDPMTVDSLKAAVTFVESEISKQKGKRTTIEVLSDINAAYEASLK